MATTTKYTTLQTVIPPQTQNTKPFRPKYSHNHKIDKPLDSLTVALKFKNLDSHTATTTKKNPLDSHTATTKKYTTL